MQNIWELSYDRITVIFIFSLEVNQSFSFSDSYNIHKLNLNVFVTFLINIYGKHISYKFGCHLGLLFAVKNPNRLFQP